MCLLFFSLNTHPQYRFILAANRDEFYERPTQEASFWEDFPDLLAGRDLRAGGTWLGITRQGRIAAITNYRDPTSINQDAPSRGMLVSDFLLGEATASDYLEKLVEEGHHYNGFNLIFGNADQLYWYCNKGGHPKRLEPGNYALSNDLLDTPWPKVQRIKKGMQDFLQKEGEIQAEDIFSVLRDRQIADDSLLPDTRVGLEMERMLSPIFITSPGYGTRSSTVILIDRNGDVIFQERTFNSDPEHSRAVEYEFRITYK
jgi:uncharacterized protein with NRDE domain